MKIIRFVLARLALAGDYQSATGFAPHKSLHPPLS
jgi:hypothetical protein